VARGLAVAERRRESITRILRENGFVRNSELSSELGVSVVTIRQDLEVLRAQGLAQQTYGGAIYRPESNIDSTFDARSQEHTEAKRRIGQAAAQFIERGETIILDAGTTTLEIARRLPENADLTVVTCALNVALEASAKPGVNVILCGGRFNARTISVTGNQVERALEEVCADRLFLATYGVDLEKGLAERSFEGAQTKRSLIGAARETILVCDSSKFGAKAPVLISPLEVVSRLVTDVGIPADFLQWFEGHQIPVEAV
jgi:DeoR/GlpR family transcriptional regulator of sugar metabolism